MKECFFRLHATGVKCVALVCDGLASNIAMARKFGVVLSENTIKKIFPNPAMSSEKVFFILDAVGILSRIN